MAPVVASQVTLKLSRLKLWPLKPELCRETPESFSLVTKNSELCVVLGDVTGKMTFG